MVGLVLALKPGGVTVRAELGTGQPYDLAVAAAEVLQERLAAATGRVAEVTVVPRREPVDFYA
jgi:hypothetical protein